MEDNNMETLNENQIQFLREKLQKEVKSYIEVDDKIKALAKATKQYRKTKDELSQSILETMKKFEINDMNIKSGKLSYNERKTKKPLNRKNLLSGLTLYFKENLDRAKDCSMFVLDNREDVTKVALKRTINKM
jgi:hypothetical protein|tara:strand:+ start:1613 stop:2011 length:399 start_codon:yes stop_codon:yes gene_type:complete